MQFSVPPRGVEIVLVLLVLAAAVYDIRTRRIPNWLTASGVLAGLALNTFLYPVLPGLLFALKGWPWGWVFTWCSTPFAPWARAMPS